MYEIFVYNRIFCKTFLAKLLVIDSEVITATTGKPLQGQGPVAALSSITGAEPDIMHGILQQRYFFAAYIFI